MLVTIRTYSDAATARIDLACLRQAGLRAMLANETMHSVLPIAPMAIRLRVHEQDVQAALDLLHDTPQEPSWPSDDYRDITQKEIAFLQRQSKLSKWKPRLSPLLIIILAIPTLLMLYYILRLIGL
jgi:hypothetical protein